MTVRSPFDLDAQDRAFIAHVLENTTVHLNANGRHKAAEWCRDVVIELDQSIDDAFAAIMANLGDLEIPTD